MEGFEKVDEREIRELNTRAIRYIHRPSGADILFMKNSDENKVFGITFRTPPQDATGLPHILEHSVICGSRKYNDLLQRISRKEHLALLRVVPRTGNGLASTLIPQPLKIGFSLFPCLSTFYIA